MAAEQAHELRQRGIEAAKAGQKDEARQLLQQSLRLEPDNESAWLWLASVARNPQEQATYLEKLLSINPNNETGRRAYEAVQAKLQQPPAQSAQPVIRRLGGESAPPSQSPQPAQQQRPATIQTTQEMMAQPPGIPVPDAQRLAAVQKQAETTVQDYLRSLTPQSEIQWVHKTRRRAGERDAFFMRLYLSSGAFVVVALVIAGLAVFALNNPSTRAALFAPTQSPTFTPTFTPTSTPGLTPTPSMTPLLTLTASPTVPAVIPTDDPYAGPRPTAIYPPFGEALVQNAIALITEGNFGEALPMLAQARQLTENRFDPRPYYYEAYGLVAAGELDRALQTMEDAESRLGEVPLTEANDFRPVIDAGFAFVYAALAQNAADQGQEAQLRGNLTLLLERAEAAIEGDPDNPLPYLALAKFHRLNQDYDQALQVLSQALEQEDLRTDVAMIVERGEIYFEQQEYDLAAYEAFLALYINPETEPAHLLQINIALAKNDPGLAVIYAQNYLFYFPGSTLGYKLLGDARVREGNTDLALDAYTQALAAEQVTDSTVDVLLARAQLYSNQRRYDFARADLTTALTIRDDPQIQAQRMNAAYLAGNYATALADADELRGSGVVSEDALDLLRARALIDQASDDDTETYEEALDLLSGVGSLSESEQAIANEYRAQAQFVLNSLSNALSSINDALSVGETGKRHYLKGLILQAQGNNPAAAREFEWVVSWGEIFPFDFRADAEQRLEAINSS